MNEFKGTKGKWVVGIVPEYNDTLKSAMLEVQSEHYLVCKVQNNGMIKSEEGNANAQLIAHAPEMLEMLKKQYDFLVYCRDNMKVSRPLFNVKIMKIEQLIKEATTI